MGNPSFMVRCPSRLGSFWAEGLVKRQCRWRSRAVDGESFLYKAFTFFYPNWSERLLVRVAPLEPGPNKNSLGPLLGRRLAFFEAERAAAFGVTQKIMTSLLQADSPVLTLDKNNDILKVKSEFCNRFSKTFISKMSGVLASSIFAKKNCQKFMDWVVLPKRGRPLKLFYPKNFGSSSQSF